ncbi:MAG: dTDP-4-dehydrorhamnose reductase [Candidatus Berkelbacteria bacterium]|nr:dTDP-4-dehydrorhamnose reductase [Candidatus Berkelbacteria bacterium]
MKILITGANGQLGVTLQDVFAGSDLVLTDRDELDITDAAAVDNFVAVTKPEVIINAAGYTAVDLAEIEKEAARKINLGGGENLAAAAKKYDVIFFHISTDFVFDGEKTEPYLETDKPNPLSVYGQTKRDAETVIEKVGGKYFILRTAWLYSPFGKNFVKTFVKLGAEKPELKVVADQIGCPTYTYDLALAIKKLLTADFQLPTIFGLYHFAGAGECSWFEFAKKIVELSGGTAKIIPQTSYEYAAGRDAVTAERPKHSVLNCDKIRKLGVKTPVWQESLQKCIEILKKENN